MATHSQTQLIRTMSEAARSFASQPDSERVLELLTEAVVTNVPGVDHASISVIDKADQLITLVPTDDVVADADRLQSKVGEGPCLDAAAGRFNVVRSDDLSTEARWPEYTPGAVSLGVGAQMAMHLYSAKQSFGGLNLYFDQPGAITDETVDIAELFAIHASNALGHAREVEGLNQALATRKTIGQALGIVMERYELSEDRAFEFLVRISQSGNIKLRAVAEDIVATADPKRRAKR